MRNLKRALSLTLASVMLLGMMVVGSSAAAGYDDVKETDNVEAIEVLQAVEVMVGDERGFGPDRPVNRAEMAVVMGKLLNLDYNYYESTCPFTDVSGNYAWARGWVGACAANGIVSGRGNGIYDPGATVTAVEAASMMMRALGYFQNTEDYADGFNVVTVRQGSEIGIFKGVGTDAATPMTRNQVAQMALNALESEMVTFTGTPGVNVNGVTVGYRAEYTPRTSTETKYQAIEKRTSDVSGGNNLNRGQYYIQLGEQLYDGKLTKKYDTDEFERPSINWQYNGKEIGVYVDYDLLVAGGTFTEAVKYSELYELLTFTTINDNDLYRFVDGVNQNEVKNNFARSNKSDVPGSGQGALTEVFYNQDRDEITITSINTYLAKANSDYNATNESLSLKVYQTNATGTTKIVDSKVVPEAEGVAKDDYKLVYLSGKESVTYDVVRIFDVDIMAESSITKWSKDSTKVLDKLTTGGTEYKANPKAFYDKGNVFDDYDNQLLTDNTYNVYMDRYGNVIGVDLFEGTKNYVFITGYDRGASHISVKTADAAAIFMDGTMDVITVNVTDTNKNIRNASPAADYAEYAEWGTANTQSGDTNLNRWYTYTVANNGTYTLKPVKNFLYTSAAQLGNPTPANPKTLNSANLFLDDSSALTRKGRIYGEDATVYITVDTDDVDYTPDDGQGITDVKGVYTGAQDVKIDLEPKYLSTVNSDKTGATAQEHANEQKAYVYSIFDNDNFIIASIVLGEAQGATTNYAYILDEAKSERFEPDSSTRATDGTYYWEFDAVYQGEKTTLQARTKYPASQLLKKWHIQEVRFDGEYVTDLKDVPLDDTFYYAANGDVAKDEANTATKKIEDMKIYDVGNRDNGAWAKTTNDSVIGNGLNVHNTDLKTSAGVAVTDTKRIEGTIYLQGRTLYVDNNTGSREVGLALAKDAKAVLVQPENGKVESTSCGSVSEALGRLADRDKDTPNTQFKGRIAAVLDSAGVAQWIVVISDSNLVTGQNPDYGVSTGNGVGRAGTVNLTNGVWNPFTGALTTNLKLTEVKPWVAGTQVVVGGEVWIDGVNVGTFSKDINISDLGIVKSVNLGGYVANWNWGNMPNVELRNITVEAKKVKLRIVDEANNVLIDQATATAGNGIDFDNSGAWSGYVLDVPGYVGSTAHIVAFTWNNKGNAATETVKWSLRNMTGTQNSDTYTVAGANGVITNALADGTGYAEIVMNTTSLTKYMTLTGSADKTLGGTNGWVESYTGFGAGYNAKIEIDAATTKTVAAGTAFDVKVTLGTAVAATDGYGIRITLSDGSTYLFANDGTTGNTSAKTVKSYAAGAVNDDMTFTITKVERVAAPAIKSVTLNDTNGNGKLDTGETVTVHFSEKIKGTVAPTATPGTITLTGSGTLASDGMSATYELNAVTGGGTLTFAAAAFESDANANMKNNKTQITLTDSDLTCPITFPA